VRTFAPVLILLLASAAAAADPCDIPPGFTNQVLVLESDTLSVGFATERQVYSPLDTVNFYLVVKNIGLHEFYINWGIDPQDGGFCAPDQLRFGGPARLRY
jgi:hypothetical protein